MGVGQGGREEERLPLRREVPQHALDVGQEAHVEHAVGLVEHEDLEPLERRVGVAEVVEEAPRRRHDHVHPRAQGVLLRPHADAAEDGGAGDRGVHGQLPEVRVDLGGELAGRGEDERPRGAPRLAHQAVQDRQAERRRLAAAGGGAGEDVPALHRGRDRLLLDGGRAREAELADARAGAAGRGRTRRRARSGPGAQRAGLAVGRAAQLRVAVLVDLGGGDDELRGRRAARRSWPAPAAAGRSRAPGRPGSAPCACRRPRSGSSP